MCIYSACTLSVSNDIYVSVQLIMWCPRSVPQVSSMS